MFRLARTAPARHAAMLATIALLALAIAGRRSSSATAIPTAEHAGDLRSSGGANSMAAEQTATRRAHFVRVFEATRFLRGNLHTHTNLSDGKNPPEQAIAWYRSHGYQFLALTDHNVYSEPAAYAWLQDPGFVLLAGEEISMYGRGRAVHVNALCTQRRIAGGIFPSASAALGHAIGAVLSQGGIALVNHPNFDWALSPNDILDARDAPLLEIASAHPYVHSAGKANHPSHEALWDIALSAGAESMGVAVDDVHRIDASGNPFALPGRAWVEVFGERADQHEICSALGGGRLYASTGVRLRRIRVTDSEYAVESVESGGSVTFIGRAGRELLRVSLVGPVTTAVYVPNGGEGYVRARVENARGEYAWTPAVRVAG